MTILQRVLTPKAGALGVFAILFILYCITLAPTFGFVDKGEMAAVASTAGIAHPTGYPTIMLLGKLFTVLLPTRDVVALNIMSAMLTAAGGGVLVLLFSYMLRIAAGRTKESEGAAGKKGKGAAQRSPETEAAVESSDEERTRTVAAVCGALLTGLTATWWGQGTGFEVYSLHCLLMPLVTLLFLRFVESEAVAAGMGSPDPGATSGRKWGGFTARGIWFALVLGLSFTNHLTTILLAPPFLLWYFWRLGLNAGAFKRLLVLIPPFAAGLLPYAWLPLRAAGDPWFNWGNPETLWAFWRHVTGAQYRVWMFTNPDTFPQQTGYFLHNLSSETVWIGLVVAALGLFYLADRRKLLFPVSLVGIGAAIAYVMVASGGSADNPVPSNGETLTGVVIGYVALMAVLIAAMVWIASLRNASMRNRLAVLSLVAFLSCLFYAGGYDIMEITPYYLTAFFAVGIWMLFGLQWLMNRLGFAGGAAVAALLVLVVGGVNFVAADESDRTLVEDMTVNVLANLPENAVIFSKQWDFWLAGSFYMQAVEAMRPDVLVVDHELLRRSWYLDQLEVNYPEFMERVRPEVETFRAELYKFEHDLPYEGQKIEAAYIGLINAMIDRSMEVRPVFVTPDFDEDRSPQGIPKFGARWNRTPNYLAYRLGSDTAYLPEEFPEYRFSFSDGAITPYTLSQYWWYVRACIDRARYEAGRGNMDLARRYFDYAKTFDPGISADDIPSMPLNSELRSQEMLRNFLWLRTADPAGVLAGS